MSELKGLRVEEVEKRLGCDLEATLKDTRKLSYAKQAKMLGVSAANVQTWRLKLGIPRVKKEDKNASREQSNSEAGSAGDPGNTGGEVCDTHRSFPKKSTKQLKD